MRAAALIAAVVLCTLGGALASTQTPCSPIPAPDAEEIQSPEQLADLVPPEPVEEPVLDATLSVAPMLPIGYGVPPPEPAHGPVRIRVLGPTGLAVPGLKLNSMGSGCDPVRVDLGVTDADGRLTAADLPYDGFTYVQVADAALGCVTGPDLEIHATLGLELRVVVLDAESGSEVRGATWKTRSGTRTRSGEALVVPAGPGRSMDLPWTWIVSAPSDFIAFDSVEAGGLVSRYATSLLAAHPLRREADVEVEVREADGRPARDAEVTEIDVAGSSLNVWSAERFAAGVLRLHGIPYFRGEPLSITAAPPGDARRSASWSGTLPDECEAPTRARIDLPSPDTFEGPACNSFIGVGGHRNLRCGCCCGHRTVTGTEGAVTVVVRRRDGTPAAGAKVSLLPGRGKTLDAAGTATWEKVVPGTYVVRLQEPGLVPCEASVDVPENGDVTVELVEPSGGDVDVVVVDEDGRGFPFASIAVKTGSGLEWLDVAADGVQRIDRFVDERGLRRLAHVEPGTLEISATFGTRRGTATAIVEEGGRTVARIVLK